MALSVSAAPTGVTGTIANNIAIKVILLMGCTLLLFVLGADGFSAVGSGSAYSNINWSQVTSIFDITFSVANDTSMTLNGTLYGVNIYGGSGNASLFLYKGDNQLIANQLYGNSIAVNYLSQSAAISYSALLGAGEYRLVAKADPYFIQANSSYSLSASFVPVPAAVWLLGSGLLGLVGFMRKRRSTGG